MRKEHTRVTQRTYMPCYGWFLVAVGIAIVLIASILVTFQILSHNSSQPPSEEAKAPSCCPTPIPSAGPSVAGPSTGPNAGTTTSPPGGNAAASYVEALKLSLTFLDIQKSGNLPSDYPIEWRKDSALNDGSDVGIDLSGGLYDAGDYMKFSFPMAFTATMLSWSVLEYGSQMEISQQLANAKEKIQWITDYLIKANPSKGELYFQVGDPEVDHGCWQRAEDMGTMQRPSYKITTSLPGTEVAAEAAAAMASASMVFRNEDPLYSSNLLRHAKGLFRFAKEVKGSYSSTYPEEKKYYASSGYMDELIWAAVWIFYATREDSYLEYATCQFHELSSDLLRLPQWLTWDNKISGVQVLLARYQLLETQQSSKNICGRLDRYQVASKKLVCSFLPDSPTTTTNRTKGGILWVTEWNSIHHSINSALLALIYSDYLFTIGLQTFSCNGTTFTPKQLREFSMSQADYILGENPMSLSYLVGYGSKYPQQVHHRGASIPSDSVKYGCKEGFKWLYREAPNPHLVIGALVGGPFKNDSFIDKRNNSVQNEPTTYNSAVMAGLMAGLSAIDHVKLSSWT